MKSIMIFIPGYKAAATIASVLDSIRGPIYERAAEILFQDNCSPDEGAENAERFKREHQWEKLTIVRNEKNLYYGGTKKKAYQYAIDKGYDIVIMLHADGQYPSDKFWDMVKPLEDDQADMTIGVRKDEREGGMPLWKLMGNRLLTWMENVVCGIRLSEWHSGYKAYTTKSLKGVPFWKDDNGHPISSEIIMQYILADFRVKEVPVQTHYGGESSQISLKTSITYGISVLKNLALFLLARSRVYAVPKFDVAGHQKKTI